MWKIGTVIQTASGSRRVITRISPPGEAGTSYADGPTYHATVVGPDDSPIPGGHTAAIWSKSMSYPTSNWKAV